MEARRIIFRVHALQRMFERGISETEVREVIAQGDAVEFNAEDVPYPSRLMLGWIDGRAIHVVASDVPNTAETVIITVYEPDPGKWDPTRRRRR